MAKAPISWLKNELPSWIKDGLLTEESSKILLSRYENSKPTNYFSIAMLIFAGILISLGVISLLAYNWESIPRAVKTILAILILLPAQALVFFTNKRYPQSAALREFASVLWLGALASSLAIIGQLYNLGGNLIDYLQMLIILSLPIMYLLNSKSVAFLLAFAVISFRIIVFADEDIMGRMDDSPPLYSTWFLLFLWLPFYIYHLKENKLKIFMIALNIAFMALFTTYFATNKMFLSNNEYLEYVFLFVSLCLFSWTIGVALYNKEERFYKRVFEITSKIFIFITLITLIFTFDEIRYYKNEIKNFKYLVAIFSVDIALILLFFIKFRDRFYEMLIPLTPVTIVILHYFTKGYYEDMEGIKHIYNVVLFLGGTLMVVGGFRGQNVFLANQGLLLITIILLINFFDSNLPLFVKGICFIAAGVMFLVLNIMLKKSIKGVKNEKN